MLATVGGALSGLIHSADYRNVYEIRTLPAGGQHLLELDSSGFPECGGEVLPPGWSRAVLLEGSQGQTVAEAAASPAQVRILVVYTKKARDAAGGTDAVAALALAGVQAANTAYQNSKLTARQVFAGAAEIGYKDGNDFLAALNWVTKDKKTAGLRDKAKADLVALIFEGPNPLTACGLGWMGIAAGQKYAFSVSARTCVIGNNAQPHETGHNQGLAHNPEDAAIKGHFAYSHGHYSAAANWITIMSYRTNCQFCTGILNFSNPAVSVNGVATGINNQRNNAKTLKTTAGKVDDFRN